MSHHLPDRKPPTGQPHHRRMRRLLRRSICACGLPWPCLDRALSLAQDRHRH